MAGFSVTAPISDSIAAAGVSSSWIINDLSKRTSARTSTTEAFAVPAAVPHEALDAVMADQEYSAHGEDEDTIGLLPPLEEAVEELLTALHAQTA